MPKQPDEYPKRFPVPQDKLDWTTEFEEYDPPYFVSPTVIDMEGVWAESEDFSTIDRDFFSFEKYPLFFDEEGRPLNPVGRTGIAGRGLLGKWGANFAVDPIILRKVDEEVQVLSIQRSDFHIWALPGGFIDDGETAMQAISRELYEETGIHMDFSEADTVYTGYILSARATDHAWIETTAMCITLSPLQGEKVIPAKTDDEGVLNAAWITIGGEEWQDFQSHHRKIIQKCL